MPVYVNVFLMEENHTNIVTDDTQEFYKFVLFAWTPSSTIQQRKLGFSGDCVYIVYVMKNKTDKKM